MSFDAHQSCQGTLNLVIALVDSHVSTKVLTARSASAMWTLHTLSNFHLWVFAASIPQVVLHRNWFRLRLAELAFYFLVRVRILNMLIQLLLVDGAFVAVFLLTLELLLSIRAMLHHGVAGEVNGKSTTLWTLFSFTVLDVYLDVGVDRAVFESLYIRVW